MATLSLNTVHKSYGVLPIIHGVSIDIADGEFVTLVGPSGCGKSTLLRMIAGLETISAGEIRIADRLVNDLPPRARDIAMVFQNYALYPNKNVAQNMGYALKLAGRPQAEIDRRVSDAADILGLKALLQRRPAHLSGGQRQRVAMGRAIVRDPKIFLFDEPLSNLDAKLRVVMRTEIKELHQRLKTTTVYVTHDQIEAMTMADRIVVMRDGIVEQAGRPLELYDQPRNVFVAGFLGSPSMNLIGGRMTSSAAKPIFVTEDGVTIPMPSSAPSVAPGKAIFLGIRPEHLSAGSDACELPMKVRVGVIEPTGAETLVAARFGESPVVALIRERIDLIAGTELTLRVDPRKLHFFDAETGLRLS
ncbi:sn-glycerol-3-phosphate ABC transporter ATP-binding protein UgpC [Agrobacterium vitis]|uniref:Sn-glycerol-3-phosphate ABC transporter ATP-binding protein UgpC n=1 Tax=Agrobacterium vitis TaxID=373 RepID=A0AAE4WIH4_AGRVI|nr:sn-glycerol-3-phosphate ABC transporter ATP-binding protein UgpC [Agrobacterium vitis]MCF1501807.1 sn-glycerol-3-phosphate ABC transporter ATP-binding protein UgpC [Allorhizobium sp. Av2]MCM2443309.1 sn-glycerol-3-phosphate ABC transporter ATP-binding protein UgpC [Agrobacterium vitis]MUZ60929.1 sn-glycerol-3-phosphate ABC transporter ATP-binding protein UgpC [Agrobacterium vitis]MVA69213.1 sn-glycerol-3-phosphate ABC transporter ATP-binding protein UgpC [Agrobacterium vitis]MVA90226.1 sn-g